ncbi:hypothetical protein ADL27_48755, partial [Streptomyces sp. NRRL F-6602]
GQGEGAGPYASFLDRVDEFDPAPFRISPREAPLIDPQARIVYETVWEALEDAAVPDGAPRTAPPACGSPTATTTTTRSASATAPTRGAASAWRR